MTATKGKSVWTGILIAVGVLSVMMGAGTTSAGLGNMAVGVALIVLARMVQSTAQHRALMDALAEKGK